MSDSIEELSKQYRENVLEEHARSVGLFPIPEYPEFEERGMWSSALDVLLTTLRYIAPATILTLFWGQQSFLFKLLKYIDSALRALIFSSEEQKQTVLQWLAEAGPVRVDKLEVVWRHGWIVCGVLDNALPGACAGHPPTRLTLKHAQAIADHYLGVEPVFSRQELESNDSLSRHQEWKLIHYLENIRLSLSKLTPPTSRNTTTNQPIQKTTPEATHFTLDYIARGSGLVAAQIKNKVYFKIYPTAQQSLDPGEISILINGPKETYGMTVLPPILGKAQMIRQNLLGLQSKTTFTENVLPITQGTNYLRSYRCNNINKTFYIPKTKYDIEIDVEVKQDHARVCYVASLEGKYEISITSRGQNIVGSPFKITASNNIVGALQKDSFCLEDGEEIDIVDVKTDRKVVLRIVDFVTEKMLLNENGTLQKISEEEAQQLMQTKSIKNSYNILEEGKTKAKNVKSKTKSKSFCDITNKVIKMNRVCKIFQNITQNKVPIYDKNCKTSTKNKQDVPDIVNSTFNDEQPKTNMLLETRSRVIIPENISVSLLTEKPSIGTENPYYRGVKLMDTSNTHTDSFEDYNALKLDSFEDDTVSIDTVQSANNPFLNDTYDATYAVEKGLGSFIQNEYETNNSQNEETENLTSKLHISNEYENRSQNINPFIDILDIERPKTPVYKIITGNIANRNDSVFIDPKQTSFENENIYNPFLKHEPDTTALYQEKPDFIIGAPVSVPPVFTLSSKSTSKSNREIITNLEYEDKANDHIEEYSRPPRNSSTLANSMDANYPTDNNNFSSLDSNLTQDVIIIARRSPTPTSASQSQGSREMSPKKDTWDSAYVSIDDNNSSSENNINELINESLDKRKYPSLGEILKMGPAEREIWQSDCDLKDLYLVDDYKTYKCDLKKPEFTPIIEENEKIPLGMKEDNSTNAADTDSVTQIFAELNDIYEDCFTNSEISSVTTTHDDKLENLGIDYTVKGNDIRVDSASEILTDVKRHTTTFEGKISEVQTNVTESSSVSQNLHVKDNELYEEQNNNTQIQFGDRVYTNIVLEKKKYWDEKIRKIEEKSEELKSLQNKRRLFSKNFRRNDSITKKKGKKIIQKYLQSTQEESDIFTKSNMKETENLETQNKIELLKSATRPFEFSSEEPKICHQDTKTSTFVNTSPTVETDPNKLIEIDCENEIDNTRVEQTSNSTLQLKPELSEKVFQAFETSPKRFFGTSRKHILNKIDTFLGSPNNEEDTEKIVNDVRHESGLVSSRISLFHNISNTEDLTWARRKFKSMYNIPHYDKNNQPESNSNKKSYKMIESKSLAENNNYIENESLDYPENCSVTTENRKNNKTPLEDKRLRLIENKNNRSFDETLITNDNNIEISNNYVKKAIKGFSETTNHQNHSSKMKSISKSEMDIFNKANAATVEDELDKHRSYDELPKVSVKNFISLYEDASKISNIQSLKKPISKIKTAEFSRNVQVLSSIQGNSNMNSLRPETPVLKSSLPKNLENFDSCSSNNNNSKDIESVNNSIDFEIISNQDKETNFLSLSDIELEIIDKDGDRPASSPEKESAHLEYKTRFSMAKRFFQSLEELRENNTLRKFKKLETKDSNTSTESLEDNVRPRKKSNIKKSHSMPSSEISKIWNEMQEQKEDNKKKLVKISEKFNVDDLFEDVMEGRLSRQGSLRGIPHKKAVLETFRSMENIVDNKLNSYEMAESQLNEFAKENQIRNAQTYLSEYPYLPTTDPSKYYSRVDVNASGLITFKELKKTQRRNSVPNLRLNPTFTAEL